MSTSPAITVRVIVVMGVAGSGKTTTGRALATALGWPFYDADDSHPPANIEKMTRGQSLTDDDRRPWLAALCTLIDGIVRRADHAVLACSALKRSYRERLLPKGAPSGAVRFVHLEVPVSELRRRLGTRHHYFRSQLLDSQLATLEPPRRALIVDGTSPVDVVVNRVRTAFEL